MANKRKLCQYGLWTSPITPTSLAKGIGFSDVAWDEDGTLVWLESRSNLNVLVVQPADGSALRDLHDSFSARAKVGYGGGDFGVRQGIVYFVDADSGRIYRQPLESGQAMPVTPAFGRSASPTLSPDGNWLLFVNSYEGRDVLAVVDALGNIWPQILASGADFYMQPTWHPNGDCIAWVEWDHPNMPWDGTLLKLAELECKEGSVPVIREITVLTGGENTSIFQPYFSPDGRYLAYVSDADGWWQLYLYDFENHSHEKLTDVQAEHGSPAWVQGVRTYGFTPDGRYLIILRNQNGSIEIWQFELATRREKKIILEDEYTYFSQISVSDRGISCIASGGRIPTRVITIPHMPEDRSEVKVRVVRRATAEYLPRSVYSEPQAITWTGEDGEDVHGIFLPPRSEKYQATGKPPLIMKVHGGPTSQRYLQFDLADQFFTSRGYAVLNINYRGSTGYGRAYRNRLRGNWGVLDIEDTISGAQHLVNQDLVDRSKLVVMGGSAGGFTVLKVLQEYPGFFKAGINLFGVTNQFTLAADTHKFEAHYLDSMIGPLPIASDLYKERSPIFFVDRIEDPLAVFQGEDDVVVPRAQSDELVQSLVQRGIEHIYHLYPGEGHGFRKQETIEHMYTQIDRFLMQYVVFS